MYKTITLGLFYNTCHPDVWNLSRVKIAREVAKALCEAFGIEFSEGTGKYERKEKWMVGFPEGYFESKEENITPTSTHLHLHSRPPKLFKNGTTWKSRTGPRG